jgi:hypothetical protein
MNKKNGKYIIADLVIRGQGYRKITETEIRMVCSNCNRELPNKDHKTKCGCKWCDVSWHKNKIGVTTKDLLKARREERKNK